MAIEHDSIVDTERHEVKGASGAAAGEVLTSDGAGATLFQPPAQNTTITYEIVLAGASTATQTPVGADTPLKISFGSAQNGPSDPVQISAAGDITFNEAGQYLLKTFISIGRASGSATSVLIIDRKTNGVGSPFPVFTKIDTTGNINNINADIFVNASAADVTYFDLTRDSSGNNSGNLQPFVPALGSISTCPSAFVAIYRVVSTLT